MGASQKAVGIVCGGGDCPGLNAVIRAVVHHATHAHSIKVVGIEGSFQGLLQQPRRVRVLDVTAVSGILQRGGTILGTTNHGNPFRYPVTQPDGSVTLHDRAAELARAVAELHLEGLVVLGGDGTLAMGARLMKEQGVKIIGVPKSIDNDLGGTSATFGFTSAVGVVTDALDRLHSTAESHDRVMVLEVMGRNAGHIALAGGIAGGADVILMPEAPFTWEGIMAKVEERRRLGRNFSIVVAAEGACLKGGTPVLKKAADPLHEMDRLGGVGDLVAREIERRGGMESRVTVLGHLQRGGSPAPLDRVLASALGVHAVDMVASEKWGRMASLAFPHVVDVPLEEALQRPRLVDLDGTLANTARRLGITFAET